MTTILSSYAVNEATMALLPAAHIKYDTIAIESNQTVYIRQTPHQLLRRACLENWSTYEGRRESIKHHFGFKRKVPIPINPHKLLFAFPTHSPEDFACNWIFYSHVQTILPQPTLSKNADQEATIRFQNGHQLTLDVSRYVLQKQLERTGMCVWKFGNGSIRNLTLTYR